MFGVVALVYVRTSLRALEMLVGGVGVRLMKIAKVKKPQLPACLEGKRVWL